MDVPAGLRTRFAQRLQPQLAAIAPALVTSATSGPGPISGRSVEPVLHLQPRYPVEIPPVAGDENEVPPKRHPGQPDVLQSKVLPTANQRRLEQEHNRSLEVDLAVRSGKPAERTDFLQGGEEGIVSLDGIGRVFGCVGKGFRSMENGPQSILDERAQRLPVPAGLSLRQVQKSLINIQDRLHDVKLGCAGVAVNVELHTEGGGVHFIPTTRLASGVSRCVSCMPSAFPGPNSPICQPSLLRSGTLSWREVCCWAARSPWLRDQDAAWRQPGAGSAGSPVIETQMTEAPRDEQVLEYFRDKEKREEFYAFFKELQNIYEILSPDAFLRSFLADYDALLCMFHLLRANYDRDQPVDKEFLRKTAKLVQAHTQSGAIEDPTKFHALNAKALEAIANQKQSDTVKVFNLLKALASLVNAKAGGEPYLISIGDRAQEIAEAFESRQMTTQQALELLEKLIAELKGAEKDRDATGLSPEAFAVFYVLKTDGVKDPLKAAQAVEAAFQLYPHWQTSEHQEQDVRRSIYKALIDAGIEAVVEVATKLMKLLRRASP